MGKAGNRKFTAPIQPKAPEDSYQKGTNKTNKYAAVVEDDSDEEEPVSTPPARIGPPVGKRRELPYADVPPLTTVTRTDKPRPVTTTGPAYTTRAPIEKEELGKEMIDEILNAPLDVTIGQLLGSAPNVRKELIKQLAKVRKLPGSEPLRALFTAMDEDVPEEGKSEPVKEDKEWITGIDVASLPKAESTTVYNEDRTRATVTIGDPVLQYIHSLPEGETPKALYMKESTLPLRAVYPVVNNTRAEEALLDSGSQIVSMAKDIAVSLRMSWDPDICINLQSAQGHVEKTLGLAIDVPLTFGKLTVLLQIHIINNPSYKLLLGRPFDALTRSVIQNERDGSQLLTITDPASDIRIQMPTFARGKPPKIETETSQSFQDSMI